MLAVETTRTLSRVQKTRPFSLKSMATLQRASNSFIFWGKGFPSSPNRQYAPIAATGALSFAKSLASSWKSNPKLAERRCLPPSIEEADYIRESGEKNNNEEYEEALTLQSHRQFRYFIDNGSQVTASVTLIGERYIVEIFSNIEVENPQCNVFAHWGLYRSEKSSWVLLEPDEAPPGTTYYKNDEAMRTPFQQPTPGSQSLALEFSADVAPFFVDFVLLQTGAGPEKYFQSSTGSSFSIPVGLKPGSPSPLGSTFNPRDGSVNFSVISKAAHGVILCLYAEDEEEPSMEIDLDPGTNKTGDTWHVSIDRIGEYTRYGYRCRGEVSWQNGDRFFPRQVLLDPYARHIATPVPGQVDLPSPAAALGLIDPEEFEFDWGADFFPRIPLEESVAYRMSVKGFTADSSSGVSQEYRGTFAGVVQKIDHLLNLGVNAVILQPIAAFDETQGPYFPLNFFAPSPSLGHQNDPLSASHDLKFMVKELHRHGIEVILEVVLTHTAEQNDEDPKIISMRGIDNATYYRTDASGSTVPSRFGAPNSLNVTHPVTQQLLVSSLRHWVSRYHVDGFVVVGADALFEGALRSAVMEDIAFDAVLAGAKLIADREGFLGLKTNPQPGPLPHWSRWQEVNPPFQTDIRRFVRGETGQIGSLATRIFGSADMFSGTRGPCFGLNKVTSSTGYSLGDLVSFTNEAEFSWGCGEEGQFSSDPAINACRLRQVKNFLSLLFLSQGVPVLSMADEITQSKTGLEEVAFDWGSVGTPSSVQVMSLIANLAAFRRRRADVFQRKEFLGPGFVTWHGYFPESPQWDNPESRFLAVSLRSAPPEVQVVPLVKSLLADSTAPAVSPVVPGVPNDSAAWAAGLEDLYLAINSHHEQVVVYLPDPPTGTAWFRVMDTNLEPPEDFTLDGIEIVAPLSSLRSYTMQAFSVLLLEARTAGMILI